ncbi:glycosyltransferase family 4 protein [Cyanobium sp. FACHB-13342]|uniref:glycosyltransferase family 4 protein n=1 Tax=Cyanobium sp. FACHB-13342 TaxID=2692793 RepID=UPI0016805D64|nr:glycosyltransferase family 4 protein [Cyanobium sp. FACHB-13342]MBD2424070.1 glycosyltransferase family 4 protein [Cyanobium sp. FACHB-13342]
MPVGLPDVVVTNFHRRYTGVSATVRALVPLQRQSLPIGLLDWGRLGLASRLRWWDLLWRGWSRPSGGRYRVWHARRDVEIVAGLLLKKLFRQPWKIVFTSAAPKPPGAWLAALLRHCDAVIATSARSAQFLSSFTEIIQHGVDIDVYSPPPDDALERLHEPLNLPGLSVPPSLQNLYWIGAFGRIRPSKGTDLLVEALIQVLPDFPAFAAVMTGLCQSKDAGFQRELQDKIDAADLTDRIVFLGDLDRETVLACYRRVLLCVAASRTEGFGLTPLEAMACGRAVLVSGAGVWPQVVDSEVGSSFETGSVASLATALRGLLQNPPLLWQQGRRGRERAVACHSLQGEADRINQLYRRLMA